MFCNVENLRSPCAQIWHMSKMHCGLLGTEQFLENYAGNSQVGGVADTLSLVLGLILLVLHGP